MSPAVPGVWDVGTVSVLLQHPRLRVPTALQGRAGRLWVLFH